MERKHEIIYSEPVRTIMGSPPRAMIRWGTTAIFAIFTLFFIFAWLFRYPDLIPSPVEITTENPPVTLVAKVDGRLKLLLAGEKEHVKKDQVVAVLETAASFAEYQILSGFIDTVKSPLSVKEGSIPDLSELGELQENFSNYRKSLTDINSFRKIDYYGSRISSVTEEISAIKRFIDNLKIKEKLASQNLILEYNKFRRDSGLNAGQYVSSATLESTRQSLIREQIDLQQIRLDISASEIEVLTKRQAVTELSKQREDELNKLTIAADEAFRNLKSGMKIWENKYLLVSPVDGTATFTKVWKVNQSVSANEPVITIVPENQGCYIGRLYIKMQMSGKVDSGQAVFIKLSSFPYLEYGMLKGRIRPKSLVPEENAYVAIVDLPDSLTTLYGKKLPFSQNMQGIAEVITNDRSLLERITSPLRHLESRNRRR
jgi:HlyD family secretion protein